MHSLRKVAGSALAGLVICSCLLFPFAAEAGDALTRIKARGDLRCGISDGILGFSSKDSHGQWSGMDVDFCRALAAAVLGDPGKASFTPLPAASRFPALKEGDVDVLVRNTTWTLEREAVLGILFAGVLYYDGQGFVVPKSSGVRELSQLNGASICVVKGTTHEANLVMKFGLQNMSCRPVPVDSAAKAAAALYEGKCQAYTSERPQMTAVQLGAPGGPDQYVILPDEISKEPLGPAVSRGDEEWFTIVRWVLISLIQAEEGGFTRANIRERIGRDDLRSKAWRDLDGLIAKSLGIAPGWGLRAVESVGNYGEIFDRNLGKESPLKLDRGLNRLWTEGGLMYAPPFR